MSLRRMRIPVPVAEYMGRPCPGHRFPSTLASACFSHSRLWSGPGPCLEPCVTGVSLGSTQASETEHPPHQPSPHLVSALGAHMCRSG